MTKTNPSERPNAQCFACGSDLVWVELPLDAVSALVCHEVACEEFYPELTRYVVQDARRPAVQKTGQTAGDRDLFRRAVVITIVVVGAPLAIAQGVFLASWLA